VCKLKLRTELLQITQCLDQDGIDYALCGGLAVAAHGYPRLTKDIGLLIQPSEVDSSHIALLKINYDSKEGLIKMKRIAGRLQDLADIEAIERVQ